MALKPGGACSRQRVGSDDRAGVVFDAVDAVGVGGQHPDIELARAAQSRSRAGTRWRARRAPGAAPLRALEQSPWSRHRFKITHGRANGWPRRSHRACQRGVHLADLARFAFDLVAEDVRLESLCLARRGGRGLQALLRRGDQMQARGRRTAASPGFGVSNAPLWQAGARGRRHLDAVALRAGRSASAKVVGSATVGPEAITEGSPSRRRSRLNSRRRAARRQPAALDRRQVLAHAFISSIAARQASSAALMRCLSASVSPSAGRLSSAEPPPEIRHTATSSALSP